MNELVKNRPFCAKKHAFFVFFHDLFNLLALIWLQNIRLPGISVFRHYFPLTNRLTSSLTNVRSVRTLHRFVLIAPGLRIEVEFWYKGKGRRWQPLLWSRSDSNAQPTEPESVILSIELRDQCYCKSITKSWLLQLPDHFSEYTYI